MPGPAPSCCLGDLAEGSIRVPPLSGFAWVRCYRVFGENPFLWCISGLLTLPTFQNGVAAGIWGFLSVFNFWKGLLPNSHCSSTTTVGGRSSCPQSSGPDAPFPFFHDQASRSHSLRVGAAHMGVSAAWLFLPQVRLLMPKPLLSLTPFSGSEFQQVPIPVPSYPCHGRRLHLRAHLGALCGSVCVSHKSVCVGGPGHHVLWAMWPADLTRHVCCSG